MASDSVAEPLSAWAPKAPGPLKTPWRPLSVQTVYSVSGGYLGAKKTCALSSKTLDVQRTVDGSDITVAATFIRINKNDDWMLKAVGGPKAQKGFLKRTTLIERMRSKLVDRGLCDTSVADERVDDDGDDPMGQLDCPVERPASRPKRTRYARKRVKNQEVTITMPMYASCAYPDNKETKDVTVMADGTNQLWVLKEDLPWLLATLADECGYGGVPVANDCAAVADGICPAAPGVNIKWDFQSSDGWIASFVHGPLLGQPSVACKVSKFSQEKWDKVNATHTYGKEYAHAAPSDLKNAAYDYIVAHCVELIKTASQPGSSSSAVAA